MAPIGMSSENRGLIKRARIHPSPKKSENGRARSRANDQIIRGDIATTLVVAQIETATMRDARVEALYVNTMRTARKSKIRKTNIKPSTLQESACDGVEYDLVALRN